MKAIIRTTEDYLNEESIDIEAVEVEIGKTKFYIQEADGKLKITKENDRDRGLTIQPIVSNSIFVE